LRLGMGSNMVWGESSYINFSFCDEIIEHYISTNNFINAH